jgi:FKBP-type peptidyl-prolyl cis-trans isomerase FklB
MSFCRFLISLLVGLTLCFDSLANINVIRRQPSSFSDMLLSPSAAELNKELGRLFLAKNMLDPDIFTLNTGLQFRVIRNGIGIKPTPSDLVTIGYMGKYLSGNVFERGPQEGITLPMAALLPGIQQALRLMDVGSVWEIFVPSELGHGQNGVPGIIGANQTVIYVVRLMNITLTKK